MATSGEGGSVLTASLIAQLTNGSLKGDAGASVRSVAALDRAAAEQLSFCGSPKYAALLARTGASVVLVTPDLAESATTAAARVVVPKPQEALVGLLPRLYRAPARTPGVHPSAVVGRGVTIGSDAAIGPFVQIGDGAILGDRVTIDANGVVGAGVTVGDDSHLYPGAALYAGTQLGRRVSIHANAVIGSDGFGYISSAAGHAKIPHVGRCVIEDDVEIGAGTTIDRGSIDDTVIGAGTKIDNLVQIAHNVRVGRLCLIASQAGISGSARLEDGVVVGGQAGFQGHHTIGKGARIGGQSGVFGDVPAGETWSGYPARPHREALRTQAALAKLAGMLRDLERLVGGGRRETEKDER